LSKQKLEKIARRKPLNEAHGGVNMRTKNPVHESDVANEIAEALRVAVPALTSAVWESYQLSTGDFKISARWNDDADAINIRIHIRP
jgi:hypothetical protein